MNKFFLLIYLVSVLHLSASNAFAQDFSEDDIEKEINSAQGTPPPEDIEDFEPGPEIEKAKPQEVAQPKPQEPKKPEVIVERYKPAHDDVSADRTVNRFPKDQSLFNKPTGPAKGGSVRVPHPRAAEGLLRINKDGSYQYKTAQKEKSQSSAFKISSMTAPDIHGAESAITYKSMYGSSDLVGVGFEYDWQPFRGFGALGVQLETGFWTASGKGSFKRNPTEKAQETYNIFIVPATVFLNYRFEFVRRQWVVPFVNGGATFYGMAEIRDDAKSPAFGGAPAAGGGGGLLFSISRLDAESAFRLSEEYGIADMWIVVEARAMKGLSQDVDFTSQTINAGIMADF
jgi:hypothetical protein